MKEKIVKYVDNSIEVLQDIKSKLTNKKIQSITIDEKYFHNQFINDVNISEFFEEFKELKKINKPVLYWFELTSHNKNQLIRDNYIGYREKIKRDFKNPKYRNTSSYKSNFKSTSKTLYVGKVEKGFWGRLVTHLGYNQSIKTAGMQLFHWYKPELYGDLKLNFIVFDDTMKHLIIILEKQLAESLEPLIGRY